MCSKAEDSSLVICGDAHCSYRHAISPLRPLTLLLWLTLLAITVRRLAAMNEANVPLAVSVFKKRPSFLSPSAWNILRV